MARQIDGRSRLDHAVEAALLLAHVALRSDDRVGLVAFGESIEKVVPPVWGVTQLRALARAVHALSPTLREPPYEALAASVLSRFSRRSLVVLFSDAAEPSSIDSFVPAVRALSRKHLVVCAIFRDEYIERARGEAIVDENQLFLAGAAAELQVERDRSLLRLSRGGALVVEAPAEALSTHVVNRYLDVRARHLL